MQSFSSSKPTSNLGSPHTHMALNISPRHKTHLCPGFRVLVLLSVRSIHAEGQQVPSLERSALLERQGFGPSSHHPPIFLQSSSCQFKTLLFLHPSPHLPPLLCSGTWRKGIPWDRHWAGAASHCLSAAGLPPSLSAGSSPSKPLQLSWAGYRQSQSILRVRQGRSPCPKQVLEARLEDRWHQDSPAAGDMAASLQVGRWEGAELLSLITMKPMLSSPGRNLGTQNVPTACLIAHGVFLNQSHCTNLWNLKENCQLE